MRLIGPGRVNMHSDGGVLSDVCPSLRQTPAAPPGDALSGGVKASYLLPSGANEQNCYIPQKAMAFSYGLLYNRESIEVNR